MTAVVAVMCVPSSCNCPSKGANASAINACIGAFSRLGHSNICRAMLCVNSKHGLDTQTHSIATD